MNLKTLLTESYYPTSGIAQLLYHIVFYDRVNVSIKDKLVVKQIDEATKYIISDGVIHSLMKSIDKEVGNFKRLPQMRDLNTECIELSSEIKITSDKLKKKALIKTGVETLYEYMLISHGVLVQYIEQTNRLSLRVEGALRRNNAKKAISEIEQDIKSWNIITNAIVGILKPTIGTTPNHTWVGVDFDNLCDISKWELPELKDIEKITESEREQYWIDNPGNVHCDE